MVEHVQVPRTARGDPSRTMVLVASGYAVFAAITGLVAEDADPAMATFVLVVFSVVGALMATPLLFRGRVAFRVACVITAAAVVTIGLVMAIAGLYLLWPAALPLLLAATPLPRAHPPWPHITTAVLIAGALISFFTTDFWLS